MKCGLSNIVFLNKKAPQFPALLRRSGFAKAKKGLIQIKKGTAFG
jgi:hypothetical protein